jgi:hypothetical protein
MSRLLLITVCVALLLGGCFFKTRTPQQPDFGGGCEVDFQFNDSWQNVLFNMEGALKCGDASEYLNVINADFVYQPTSSLAANHPDVFGTVWTKDKETTFIQNAFTGSLFQASLADSILSGPTISGDITRLTASYVVNEVDADGIPTGRSWDGIAEYEFQGVGLVTLVLWRDDDSSGFPFGELRAALGGGN